MDPPFRHGKSRAFISSAELSMKPGAAAAPEGRSRFQKVSLVSRRLESPRGRDGSPSRVSLLLQAWEREIVEKTGSGPAAPTHREHPSPAGLLKDFAAHGPIFSQVYAPAQRPRRQDERGKAGPGGDGSPSAEVPVHRESYVHGSLLPTRPAECPAGAPGDGPGAPGATEAGGAPAPPRARQVTVLRTGRDAEGRGAPNGTRDTASARRDSPGQEGGGSAAAAEGRESSAGSAEAAVPLEEASPEEKDSAQAEPAPVEAAPGTGDPQSSVSSSQQGPSAGQAAPAGTGEGSVADVDGTMPATPARTESPLGAGSTPETPPSEVSDGPEPSSETAAPAMAEIELEGDETMGEPQGTAQEPESIPEPPSEPPAPEPPAESPPDASEEDPELLVDMEIFVDTLRNMEPSEMRKAPKAPRQPRPSALGRCAALPAHPRAPRGPPRPPVPAPGPAGAAGAGPGPGAAPGAPRGGGGGDREPLPEPRGAGGRREPPGGARGRRGGRGVGGGGLAPGGARAAGAEEGKPYSRLDKSVLYSRFVCPAPPCSSCPMAAGAPTHPAPGSTTGWALLASLAPRATWRSTTPGRAVRDSGDSGDNGPQRAQRASPRQPPPFRIGSFKRVVRGDGEGAGSGSAARPRDTAERGQALAAASIIVHSGLWLLYSKPFFDDDPYVLEPGGYPNLKAWGAKEPSICSMHPIRLGCPVVERPGEPQVLIYEAAAFQGRSFTISRDIYDLRHLPEPALPTVGSLRVLGGCWVGYEKEGFRGHQYLLEEGEVPGLEAVGRLQPGAAVPAADPDASPAQRGGRGAEPGSAGSTTEPQPFPARSPGMDPPFRHSKGRAFISSAELSMKPGAAAAPEGRSRFQKVSLVSRRLERPRGRDGSPSRVSLLLQDFAAHGPIFSQVYAPAQRPRRQDERGKAGPGGDGSPSAEVPVHGRATCTAPAAHPPRRAPRGGSRGRARCPGATEAGGAPAPPRARQVTVLRTGRDAEGRGAPNGTRDTASARRDSPGQEGGGSAAAAEGRESSAGSAEAAVPLEEASPEEKNSAQAEPAPVEAAPGTGDPQSSVSSSPQGPSAGQAAPAGTGEGSVADVEGTMPTTPARTESPPGAGSTPETPPLRGHSPRAESIPEPPSEPPAPEPPAESPPDAERGRTPSCLVDMEIFVDTLRNMEPSEMRKAPKAPRQPRAVALGRCTALPPIHEHRVAPRAPLSLPQALRELLERGPAPGRPQEPPEEEEIENPYLSPEERAAAGSRRGVPGDGAVGEGWVRGVSLLGALGDDENAKAAAERSVSFRGNVLKGMALLSHFLEQRAAGAEEGKPYSRLDKSVLYSRFVCPGAALLQLPDGSGAPTHPAPGSTTGWAAGPEVAVLEALSSGSVPPVPEEPESSVTLSLEPVLDDKEGSEKINTRPGKIILYSEAGFAGHKREIWDDVPDATSWELSHTISIRVIRGGWVMYEKPRFRGRKCVLAEGDVEIDDPWTAYGDSGDSGDNGHTGHSGHTGHPRGSRPFRIGSFKRVVRDYRTPRISLFAQENGEGARLRFSGSAEDTRERGQALAAASIIVHSGLWLLYSKPFFDDDPYVLEPGGYPNLKAWGAKEPSICSMHPIRLGCPVVERPGEPQVLIYEAAAFQGRSFTISRDIYDLRHLPEPALPTVGSLRVLGGCWVGYEKEGFRGHQYLLEEGEYRDWRQWGGYSQELLSLRLIRTDFSDPALVLFEAMDFEDGASVELSEALPDTGLAGYGSITQSIHVLSGVWVAYEGPNYSGEQYVLEKGVYRSCEDWGATDCHIASAQPILQVREHNLHFVSKILLFSEPDFLGDHVAFEEDQGALPGAFTPRSCRVRGGSWILFDGQDFTGEQHVLSEGEYPTLSAMGCQCSTAICSLRKVPLFFSEPSIFLHGLECFEGKEIELNSEVRSLQAEGFNNHVLSVRVKGGIWVLCEHGDFRGRQWLLDCTEITNWLTYSGLQHVGSLYPIRQRRVYFHIRSRELQLLLSVPDDVEDMKAGRVVVSSLSEQSSSVWYYEDGLIKNQVAPTMSLQVIGPAGKGAKAVLWSETRLPRQTWSVDCQGRIHSQMFEDMVLDIKGGRSYDRDHAIVWDMAEERPTQLWDIQVL
ncbi:LOW QUALITY PROTEIN: beta/gamma crystallin domain-containing protein 2 [Geothlypis trichas]